jgi:hypothetical protein
MHQISTKQPFTRLDKSVANKKTIGNSGIERYLVGISAWTSFILTGHFRCFAQSLQNTGVVAIAPTSAATQPTAGSVVKIFSRKKNTNSSAQCSFERMVFVR